MISKTLIILAYEKLLGCAALQQLPTAQRRFPPGISLKRAGSSQ